MELGIVPAAWRALPLATATQPRPPPSCALTAACSGRRLSWAREPPAGQQRRLPAGWWSAGRTRNHPTPTRAGAKPTGRQPRRHRRRTRPTSPPSSTSALADVVGALVGVVVVVNVGNSDDGVPGRVRGALSGEGGGKRSKRARGGAQGWGRGTTPRIPLPSAPLRVGVCANPLRHPRAACPSPRPRPCAGTLPDVRRDATATMTRCPMRSSGPATIHHKRRKCWNVASPQASRDTTMLSGAPLNRSNLRIRGRTSGHPPNVSRRTTSTERPCAHAITARGSVFGFLDQSSVRSPDPRQPRYGFNVLQGQRHKADRHSRRNSVDVRVPATAPSASLWDIRQLTDRLSPPLSSIPMVATSPARGGVAPSAEGEPPPHSARATARAAGAGARSVVPSDGKRTLRGG